MINIRRKRSNSEEGIKPSTYVDGIFDFGFLIFGFTWVVDRYGYKVGGGNFKIAR